MRLLLPLILGALLALPALADDEPLDVVTMYDGRKVEGRVVEDTDDHVVLEKIGEHGGRSRFKIPRSDVRAVAYGAGSLPKDSAATPPDQLRDDWFLLRSEGKIVGTRRLRMLSLTGDEHGYQLEEELLYFAQGRHVPEIRIRLVEWTDLRFALRKAIYREVGEGGEMEGGSDRYVRSISGTVEGGLFKVGINDNGVTVRREVEVPPGTRGRLGLREHLLRRERAIGIDPETILDVAKAALVDVRAGFVSVGERELCPPEQGRPIAVRRDELHWTENDTREISWFGSGTEVVEETVADAITAVPATPERAEAATENATRRARDPDRHVVKLPEAGIQFKLPDPSWTWTPQTARPAHTGWRVLGLVEAPVYTANVRVELHPEGALSAPGITRARPWLLERLKGVATDLSVFQEAEELPTVEHAWRIGVTATLRGDTLVRTIAVVVDRGDARVLLLVACPERSWEDGGKDAMERFVASVQLL